ncbi:MAG: Membrane transport protein [Candidatus Aerophobetes bacterium ADurb.Bin490]|nr:MAG: Membrane transport protein [Candidatus Aerophobetes bacterium ADurb.Bin490]
MISLAITVLGLLIGALLSGFIRGPEQKIQFISLVSFQNSGYLPLALIAALLSKDKADSMFIYLFLFLLGFNLIMFSFGSYLVAFSKKKEFELASLLSPPVAATLVTLGLVFFGLNKIVPDFIFKPVKMVGDCTLPLAMFVVGGNLAQIKLGSIDFKSNLLMALAKLIIMPSIGLLLLYKIALPELIGLLIIIELAMPPATLLSLITRHHKKEDLLVGQGLFLSHILSLLTIPVFLSLYYTFILVK